MGLRLFTRLGEDRQLSETVYPANPNIEKIPIDACYAAGICTGVLAVLGRSRPGTFLRCAAVCAPLAAAYHLTDEFVDHKWRVEYFSKHGSESPKPAKLFEWTGWRGAANMDTAALGGALIGLALARRRSPFPGATGWTRNLGAAVTGWAAGLLGGDVVCGRYPGHKEARDVYHAHFAKSYMRILDESVSESTGPILKTLVSYLNVPQKIWYAPIHARHQSELPQTQTTAPGSVLALHTMLSYDETMLIGGGGNLVIFSPEDSSYSGIPNACADPSELERTAADLKRLRDKYQAERNVTGHLLSKREILFDQMTQEDNAKDILRCELRILSHLTERLAMTVALIDYRSTEWYKQVGISPKEITQSPVLESPGGAPLRSTLEVRMIWQGAKALHELTKVVKGMPKEQDQSIPQVNDQFKASLDRIKAMTGLDLFLEKDQEHVTKQLEATERLLKELEEEVAKAESLPGK